MSLQGARAHALGLALCGLGLVGCAGLPSVPAGAPLLSPQAAQGQAAATSRHEGRSAQAFMAQAAVPPLGAIQKQDAPCVPERAPDAAAAAMPAQPLRVLSWNLHKGVDAGWQADLERWAHSHDLLLLQEAVLTPELRRIVEGAGHRWQMAHAFSQGGVPRGVLVAARVAPLVVCTLRAFEPWFPLPKTALVAQYRLGPPGQVLAVANLHAINFTLGVARFEEQMTAVADELARHPGPVLLSGDFNAWSATRLRVLQTTVQRLGLQPVAFADDQRRRAFGYPLDHSYVRGLQVHQAHTPVVRSSDHNPMLLVLSSP